MRVVCSVRQVGLGRGGTLSKVGTILSLGTGH